MSNHADISVDHFFDPSSKEFIHDPTPTLEKLSLEFPIARFEAWQAWLVTGHQNIISCLLDRRLSTDFNLWEFAPQKKPFDEMDAFEKLMNNNLFFLDRKNHLRLRKLALPAFSPRIMEKMKERFEVLVKERFDEIGTPESFNFSAEIAEIVPTQAIASLVGIPRDKFPIFDSLAYGVVRGINPMLTPDERKEAIKGVPEGLDLLNELIDERRANPGDDFLSTLILAEDEGSKLSNLEMCALVGAVLGAGSDTAVDLHSYLIKNLLQHPKQYNALMADETLVQGAISETLRYESSGKTGLARYASEDLEIQGHQIKKGQMVQLITSTAGMDPLIYHDPRTFDIKRDHDKSISFGQGPHYCIGVTLVRSQTEVMLKELFKRFPNLSLGDDVVYDYDHHNARRMDVMTVKTNIN
ncbi:MAG: cytochrome P450 [Gammaproteobacteria bacterium]|jgi:cytochrome P450|nr:cytochrome P450 [Gammaproteobacteria bacterium]